MVDSRMTIIVVADGDTLVWITEFPQSVDVFMSMDKHRIKLWERGKNNIVVSDLACLHICINVYVKYMHQYISGI